MAGDWIKMRVHLDTDPAVIFMADALDTTVFEVVGLLHWLWSWADQHTEDGLLKGVSPSYINSKKPGFGDVLVEAGWLEVVDGGIRLPNFDIHNGKSGKKRSQTKNRQQAFRNAESVTKALPEKRRAEKRETKRPTVSVMLKEPEFDSINSPEVLALFNEWLAYRKERGLSVYVESSLRRLLVEVKEAGYDAFKEAVNKSITNGYQGVFPNGQRNKRGAGPRSKARGDYPEPGGSGPEVA